jgi:tyrosinase
MTARDTIGAYCRATGSLEKRSSAMENINPALSVASTAPAVVTQALQASLIRVRPSVAQANIPDLSAAYKTMQGRTPADNRSWIYWAEYHGFNRYDCWHHSGVNGHQYNYDLFLPWHRAYLHYWEQVALAANNGAVLPWWDWTSATSHQSGLPASFTVAQVGGQPNPLASGPVPAGVHTNPPHTTRAPGSPSQLPSAATINGILALTSFEDFTSQVQNQHDNVHGWCGGDMGVISASAFDPIFWSHHCMIDRLWYLWQVKHGINNIPPSYLTKVLAPWNLTVADVLDVRSLGYTYAAAVTRVPVANFTTAALRPAATT